MMKLILSKIKCLINRFKLILPITRRQYADDIEKLKRLLRDKKDYREFKTETQSLIEGQSIEIQEVENRLYRLDNSVKKLEESIVKIRSLRSFKGFQDKSNKVIDTAENVLNECRKVKEVQAADGQLLMDSYKKAIDIHTMSAIEEIKDCKKKVLSKMTNH